MDSNRQTFSKNAPSQQERSLLSLLTNPGPVGLVHIMEGAGEARAQKAWWRCLHRQYHSRVGLGCYEETIAHSFLQKNKRQQKHIQAKRDEPDLGLVFQSSLNNVTGRFSFENARSWILGCIGDKLFWNTFVKEMECIWNTFWDTSVCISTVVKSWFGL